MTRRHITDRIFSHIGAGGVGSKVLEQIASLAKRHANLRLHLVYLAIIDKALYHQDHSSIDFETALDVLVEKGREPPTISEIVRYLSSVPGKVILADNTSSSAIGRAYPSFLENGINIVTPNKKAFSDSYELWQDIFHASTTAGSFVYHESSVGAGMPIISTLNDLVETGDQVTRIEGVFSGTMSFLFNAFSPVAGKGGKWSAEVKKAKELGYTEPDPRDDLNGLDMARKLTILGRLAGLPIESPTSFPVQSLVPPELSGLASSSEFLDRLAEFDARMEEERSAALVSNKVLRFVGSIDFVTKQIKVGIERFDKSHPFAGLQGSDNIISFHTRRYKGLPLTIRGAGAGGDVTAMGVVSDFLKVAKQI